MNNSDINIADILRDCPAGTPLYSRIAGKVEFQQIDEHPCINHPIILKPVCQNTSPGDHKLFSLTPTGRFDVVFPNGECVLFPSLEMQDWTKFFRRGDVVVSEGLGVMAVFEGWDSEDYTGFRTTVEYDKGNDIWGIKLYGQFHTLDFCKATDEQRVQFIAAAEAHYGGRFNSATLEFDIPGGLCDFEDTDLLTPDEMVLILEYNMSYEQYAEWREANLTHKPTINLRSWLMGLRHEMLKSSPAYHPIKTEQ